MNSKTKELTKKKLETVQEMLRDLRALLETDEELEEFNKLHKAKSEFEDFIESL